MDNFFIEKVTSKFPLSIGTSLAFESLFDGPLPAYDPNRIIPNKINIKDYDSFYVNVSTLFRNFLSSIKVHPDKLNTTLVTDVILEEMEIIEEVVKNNSNVDLFFYLNDFLNIEKEFTLGIIREDIKNPSVNSKSNLEFTFKKYLINKKNILINKHYLKPDKKRKSLLLSHYAIDLLDYKKFNKLSLLESNTGILKNSNIFYTKLYNGKELVSIPFNKMFLQLFGDNTIFKPYGIKIKKELLDISAKQNWNQLTTNDRIMLSIKLFGSEELKKIVL